MNKNKLKLVLSKVHLRTWVAIGIIIVLSPLMMAAVYGVFGALGGSDITPVAYWNFDEGASGTCPGGEDVCDSSTNSNDGEFEGEPVWQSGDKCISGKCLFFDGSDDAVGAGTTGFSASAGTITVWAKATSAPDGTDEFIVMGNRDNSRIYVQRLATSGNFGIRLGTSNAVDTGVHLEENRWYHLALVWAGGTYTAFINGDQVSSGSYSGLSSISSCSSVGAYNDCTGSNFNSEFAGFIDEVKIFSSALSDDEIRSEAAGGAGVLGQSDSYDFLSDGLLGYWKLDEASGSPVDSSGNGLTLTNSGTTTFVTGKYGNGSEHVPASSQHFSTATTIDDVKTVSFWVNPDSNTNYYISLSSSEYITSTSGSLSATGFSNPVIYVNGEKTTTIAANEWSFITITTDSEIEADQLYIGRQGTNYFDGTLDEVRLYSRVLTPFEISLLYGWAPGPNAHYKFDEVSGQNIFDSSGNEVHGYLGSSSGADAGDIDRTNGVYGGAIFNNLDTGGTVEVPDNDHLDVNATDSFTISTWVKRTGDNQFDNPMYIVDKQNQLTDAGYHLRIGSVGLSALNNNVLRFEIHDGTDQYTVTTDTYLMDQDSTGPWHHIAVTFDRANEDNIKIYVDGAEQVVTKSGTLSAIGSAANSSAFCVSGNSSGVNDCSGGNSLRGTIDDLKFYKYALTHEQVMEAMMAENPLRKLQLSHWNFDELEGITLNDTRISGNHMTLSTSAGWDLDGRLNGAYDFESSSSHYATINDNASLSLTGSLTLSAWINPEATTASTSFPIASKGTDYQLVQFGDEIRMIIGGEGNHETTTSANLQTGTWYHVVGSYNASSQSINIYINGRLMPSTTSGTIPSSISDGNSFFEIGRYADGSTQTFQISDSADDGHEVNNTTWTDNQSNIGIGDATIAASPDIEPGLRFTNVTLDQGETINSAYIQLYGGGMVIGSATNLHIKIYADDVDNAASWGVSSRPSQITTTTAAVDWDPSTWPNGSTIDSPDISSIIQEIVNRGGWSSGNALRLALWDDGTVNNNAAQFVDYTGDTTNAAKLIVTTGDTTNYFDGLIDEVSLYPFALTESQVLVDYNFGSAAAFSLGEDDKEQLTGGAGDAPIGYWSFDESKSDTCEGGANDVCDLSGNGSDGAISGNPVWIPGKYGAGLDLDGNGDFVTLSNESLYDFTTGDFTITGWIHPDTAQVDWAGVVAKNAGSATADAWTVQYAPSSDILAFLVNTNVNYFSAASNSDIPTGQWTHFVARVSGTEVAMYINGVKQTLTATLSGTRDANNQNVLIGSEFDGADFNGVIDEVKIYDYALNDAQIAYEYNRGEPQAWYKIDECTGTDIYDNSKDSDGQAGGKNGTLTLGASGQTAAGDCDTNANTAWFNGRVGKYNSSLNFDGTDDYVSVATTTNIDNLSQFSTAAWFKKSSSGSQEVIIEKNSNAHLYVDASNIFSSFIGGSQCSSTTAVAQDTWYHGVATYDASNVRLYLNGQLKATCARTDTTGTDDLIIGADSNPAQFFEGQIDDVRIYSYPLSSEQILNIMNNSAAVRFGPSEGQP